MKLTLFDKFGDWLLNLRIVELASQRNEAISKIKSISDTLNKHLFKLYVFQNSVNREHWKDEVYILSLNILKCTWGKKPNRFEAGDYYQWLHAYFFYTNGEKDNIRRMLRGTLRKYETEKVLKNWSDQEFLNLCDRFYKSITPYLEIGYFSDNYFDDLITMFDLNER